MNRSYLEPQKAGSNKSVNLLNRLTGKRVVERLDRHIHELFRAQVTGPAFCCSLGKKAIANLNYRIGIYDRIDDDGDAVALCEDLWEFVGEQPNIGEKDDDYSSFVAMFKSSTTTNEEDFEEKLWRLLTNINKHDSAKFSWDKNTSNEPSDADFSFSVGGKSFFIVGMHATSSRVSRSFVRPIIAFNAHAQFEHLRVAGQFDKMQNTIRNNDIAIQGDINPSLSNYGSDSEAKQYSGRLVEKEWKCPFKSAN